MNDVPHRDLEIFTAAIQLAVGERAAFLERICGGDSELHQRVEALLKTHARLGDFLEQPPAEPTKPRPSLPSGESSGDRIGPYRLLQQIGEGGCGVVYMAEQDVPIRRRVALKIIKPGMDTKAVIARFEAERQALALMDHPNIAKVFDAGETESGRPYFVMELVRGIKITEYCDKHSLTTEERLELFIQVCHAVQHAHQKGIIHRDIKPSNILVATTLEGVALPVVIDFGIAKATTNLQLTGKTVFTAFEMLIGTPAYMSPEQAELTSADVDTRTDIYSLGVLLYELLTGSPPFDAEELLKAGLDEARRVIREQEPVRPSTRLGTMIAAELKTVSQHRKSEPPRLIHAITGDLDWIAMKALEKDRTRRYETANGFALDVKRFLANEIISARPPSKLYKLNKLILRNRLLFLGIGIIALLLVVSLILVSASLTKEQQARREADAALKQAKVDKAKAETESAKSQQVTQFLEAMLKGVGPSVSLGQDTTMLRGILDRTAERVGIEMTNQPEVEAELRGLIGRLYLEIGDYDRAEKMHLSELALYRKLFGIESENAVAALNDLGNAFWKQRKLAEAEDAYNEALAIGRRLFGNDHSQVATTLNNLGAVYRRQLKLVESEALTREGLAIRRKLFGSEHLDVADSLHNLCIILGDRGKLSESEAAAQEMLAMRRRLLGNNHPLVALALKDLAWVTGYSGKSIEAESLETEAFEIQQRILGDKHPDLAKSIYSLGGRMRDRGNLLESHAVLNAALSIQRKLLRDDHPDVLATLRGLGAVCKMEGQWAEAEVAYREALSGWRKKAENDNPQVVAEFKNLVNVLLPQKKFVEAEELLGEALTPLSARQPNAELLALRAEIRGRAGRLHEAEADAAQALELQPLNDECYLRLAVFLARNQNRPAYEKLCQRILKTFPEPTNVYAADKLAKACLLLPTAEVDLRAVGHMADLAVTLPGGNDFSRPFFQLCKALAEYRQRHFAEAVEWSKSTLTNGYASSHAHAYAVQAMARYQLGEMEAARTMLAKAEELAPPGPGVSDAEDTGNEWLERIFARIFQDEANALIRTSRTPGSDSVKEK